MGVVGGVWWKFFVTEYFCSQKYLPGVLKKNSKFFFPTKFFCSKGGILGCLGRPHAPTRGSRGVGKRYTSSYDHDMTG